MKVWHKNLIEVLPNALLIGQFRDICSIAKLIATKGKTSNPFIDPILDWPETHLWVYARYLQAEMEKRGFYCEWNRFEMWMPRYLSWSKELPNIEDLFKGWHNDRYKNQCFYALQERYDRGLMSKADWERIEQYDKFPIKRI